MTARAVISAVQTTIPASIPALANRTHIHAGPFDETAMDSYARQAPCVVVTIFGGTEIQTSDDHIMRIKYQFAAYIVTVDTVVSGTTERRHLYQLDLAEAVAAVINGNTWGVGCTQIPKDLRIRNAFTNAQDMRGYNIIELVWSQWVEVINATEGLDDFETLFTYIKADPSIDDGITQQIDL